ncbi:hypothetical protein BO224_12105 [Erysipelotrichaceae bacterium NYU-BL-E8]|uniref:Uncharacterized protein n=4 Tax=Ileibacterium valens TaxID=1862668 RepID=A0A1U7NEA7_9FIRM|nr:hypothetical protein BO224_12105 [Erysipelotrichaceae bacterium NYU-BL-E8]OLU37810.1 hypothetical protein BO222_09690 [Ileibacterium valens]OLU41857.1 hypothetical protein BM735_03430 [Erysipelotrichaceae bacterium NYU-BL-F16]
MVGSVHSSLFNQAEKNMLRKWVMTKSKAVIFKIQESEMKIQDRSYWMNPEICIECFKLSKIAADHNESNIPFDGNLQNSRSAGLQYHRF